MNITEFLDRFPEFKPAQASGLVQAKLDEAALSLNSEIFGARLDEAQGYLAGHLLAISPFGRNARMVDDQNNPTSYLLRFRQVRVECSPRGFVT